MSWKKIGVIGSGTMATGISQLLLQNGYQVVVRGSDEKFLTNMEERIKKTFHKLEAKGKISKDDIDKFLENIKTSLTYNLFNDVDLIIECTKEDETYKKRVYEQLIKYIRQDVIVVSNTSSISITRLGVDIGIPERFCGMHFFNPAPIMKLVEVTRGMKTSEETINQITEFAEKIGKVPIVVNDSPGFVVNRILMPMINEAIYAYWEGVADKEHIDSAMKLGTNHPMGPLELADLIGLDIIYNILKVLYSEMGDQKYQPCPLLKRMIDAGYIGRKSKKGFYEY